MAEESESQEQPAQSKLIFFNQVDSYNGKSISKYLSQCPVGASLEEVEEEEEDSQSVHSDDNFPNKPGTYNVVGTVKDPEEYQKPIQIKDIIPTEDRNELLEKLMECDIIIYDITQDDGQIDEASWAISALHSDIEKFQSPKMFILVSSVMTWAKSKPLDPDDPEIPFTEDDYRRRKPHPNFKDHIAAEKLVIKYGKTNKNKLITYVVASGLCFGAGENIFHFLFKTAWHGNVDALPCFGNGMNIVPTIHVKDLGGILQNICDSKPKTRYLVAVDDSQSPLEDIVKAISSNLGNGKTKNITKEEALLNKELGQSDFDQLMVNLRMDAVFIKENMNIRWVAEMGLVENIPKIVKEYKHARKLLPMRSCVLGPPASGKSSIVKKLCEHYKLHHIKIKDVIDEAISNLEKTAARAEQDESEEDDGKAQEAQDLLDAINEAKENNNGRYEDQHIIQFYRDKLHSMPCQNQGFILDGFPKTMEQARELFATEDEDEVDETSKIPPFDKTTMPEFILNLQSPDEFLRSRVMNLPESVVAGTHNTEEGLTRRLAEHRALNEEDNTVLNYFDELEIHPDNLDITKETEADNAHLLEEIIRIMGEPRNYGLTVEEKEELERLEAEKKLRREIEEREEREKKEAEERAEQQRRQDEWSKRLDEVKRQEHELLENASIPLRNYLMKHVMPTLTKGLIDCCKVRPDDSIDYLAEYLFKNNPQVD